LPLAPAALLAEALIRVCLLCVLQSVVLHRMTITHAKSTFPISLGTKISGVDDSTYSSTGEAFSSVGKWSPVRPSRARPCPPRWRFCPQSFPTARLRPTRNCRPTTSPSVRLNTRTHFRATHVQTLTGLVCALRAAYEFSKKFRNGAPIDTRLPLPLHTIACLTRSRSAAFSGIHEREPGGEGRKLTPT